MKPFDPRRAIRACAPAVAIVITCLVVPPAACAQTVGAAGSIDGFLANAARNVRLRGATVEIPALCRQALTDDYGRFDLVDLPPGEHLIVTSYVWLQPQRASVTFAAEQRVNRVFELTADIYRASRSA